jgi:hypothetical protein
LLRPTFDRGNAPSFVYLQASEFAATPGRSVNCPNSDGQWYPPALFSGRRYPNYKARRVHAADILRRGRGPHLFLRGHGGRTEQGRFCFGVQELLERQVTLFTIAIRWRLAEFLLVGRNVVLGRINRGKPMPGDYRGDQSLRNQ